MYRYNRRGQVVEATTTRESEWDAEQQATMVAYVEYRSLLHEACGGYLPETTDAANEDAYRVSAAHRCHKCTAIARGSKPYVNSPQSSALLFPVEYKKG